VYDDAYYLKQLELAAERYRQRTAKARERLLKRQLRFLAADWARKTAATNKRQTAANRKQHAVIERRIDKLREMRVDRGAAPAEAAFALRALKKLQHSLDESASEFKELQHELFKEAQRELQRLIAEESQREEQTLALQRRLRGKWTPSHSHRRPRAWKPRRPKPPKVTLQPTGVYHHD
jgi:hypothetical protein